MTELRAIIVDDEPLARRRIRRLLEKDPDVVIVGEHGDAVAAVDAIAEADPDLVFLDVELPEHDGFWIIDQIGIASMPFVLFVTAHDSFAVRAFEVEAIDYLVKPFTNERFHGALSRAKQVATAREALAVWRDALGRTHSVPAVGDRLTVRQGDRYLMLDFNDISHVSAEGNYVRVHAGGHSYLLRGAIGDYERMLEPHGFRRVHRATLVNLRAVREMERMFHGDFEIVLATGARLRLSRRYRHNVPGLHAAL